MTDKDRQSSRGGAKATRAERLRAALRQNLKRRKAQARARGRDIDPTQDSAAIAADKPKD